MADQRSFPIRLLVRVYALAILLLVAWVGYTAVAYLYRAVFRPVHLPAWAQPWSGRLQADALREPASAEAFPPPAGHYHGIDRWFEPDPHNSCAAAGCHDLLPHDRNRALRAFANLHATFLDCQMCHLEPAVTPIPAVWVGLASGQPQDVPALLRLIRHFEQHRQGGTDPGLAGEIVLELLPEVVQASDDDPILAHLLVELRTTQVGSPVWRKAIASLEQELPSHARGQYGAKLHPTAGPGARPVQPDLAALTRDYLSQPPDSLRRGQISRQIHARVVAEPAGCIPCHRLDNAWLDFGAAGYSPWRAEELTGEPIARMMQSLRDGGTFALPRITGDEDGR